MVVYINFAESEGMGGREDSVSGRSEDREEESREEEEEEESRDGEGREGEGREGEGREEFRKRSSTEVGVQYLRWKRRTLRCQVGQCVQYSSSVKHTNIDQPLFLFLTQVSFILRVTIMGGQVQRVHCAHVGPSPSQGTMN